MSSQQDMVNFLAKLAPNLDAHLLLSVVKFYESRGVDVAEAKKQLLNKTKCFHDQSGADNSQPDKRIKDLEVSFKKARDKALPIIRKYFTEDVTSGAEEKYVLNVQQTELMTRKSQSDELQIQTFSSAEKFEEPRINSMKPAAFRTFLEEKYDAKSETKIVEIEVKNEIRGEGKAAKATEIWYVSVREGQGQIMEDQFNALLAMAELLYETSSYRDASEILAFCRIVMDENHKRFNATIWGLLASATLCSAWGLAESAYDLLRTHITKDVAEDDYKSRWDTTTVTVRNWALHWGLFVFFKGGEKLSAQFLDIIYDTVYRQNRRCLNQQTVETVAPHLLRYVVAACLLNRTKRSALYNTLKLVRVCYEYSDALTEFLDQLLGKVNFEEAFKRLPDVAALVDNDYFLSGLKSQIMDGATKLTYEHYIRTHKCLSIASVAKRLYPDAESNAETNAKAELWLANLIREAKVNAKIDSVGGKVEASNNVVDIHQRIFDKLSQIDRPQLH